MSEYECERVPNAPAGTLLEAPRWSEATGQLSWVDIPSGRIFLLDPDSGEIRTYESGLLPLGAALPTASGDLVLLGAAGVFRWALPTAAAEPLPPLLEQPFLSDAELISNDAQVDPWGRLYVGRMSPDETAGSGRLIVVESDGAARTVASGLTIPNGLAWSTDGDWMYFAESIERRVYRVPTGSGGEDWNRREVLVQYESELPDGLLLGPDGNLWVACFGAGRVDRWSLDGEKLGEYALPVSQVTACAFVGNDLYVTSAAEEFTAADWEREPLAGSLFRFAALLGG